MKYYKNTYKIDIKNSPATIGQITESEMQLNVSFPDEYKEFLLFSNGADGEIGDNQLVLWDLEQIVDFSNNLLNMITDAEDVPNVVVFASDGGTKGYAFDKRDNTIVSVDLDAIDIEYSDFYGHTFDEFLKNLCRI